MWFQYGPQASTSPSSQKPGLPLTPSTRIYPTYKERQKNSYINRESPDILVDAQARVGHGVEKDSEPAGFHSSSNQRTLERRLCAKTKFNLQLYISDEASFY